MQVIIFPNDNGGVSVIYPALQFSDQIEAIAAKDVPDGKPWRIIDSDDLPAKEARNRWRWTDAGPLDVAADVVPVPEEVSRFQARAALIIYGDQIGRQNLLAEADALVASLAAGQFGLTAVQVAVIKEAWVTAQVIRRDSAALNLIFPALGLSLPEQRDALLVIAGGVVA